VRLSHQTHTRRSSVVASHIANVPGAFDLKRGSVGPSDVDGIERRDPVGLGHNLADLGQHADQRQDLHNPPTVVGDIRAWRGKVRQLLVEFSGRKRFGERAHRASIARGHVRGCRAPNQTA
jgi:hypothetical protein